MANEQSQLKAWIRRGVDRVRRPRVEVDLSERECEAFECVVLGTDYGGHGVCMKGLNADSVVYSFGLGEDISFDLELIERTGAQVWGFDPTPRSIEWVRGQTVPAAFHLETYGIATTDTVATFHAPENPEHISHSMLGERSFGRSIDVEVFRLSSIMGKLGHSHVDVLKMDVEGVEYEVLEEILESGVPIQQILVEYHHQFRSIPFERTRASLALLRRHGYCVFRVAENGREMSLVRTSTR